MTIAAWLQAANTELSNIGIASARLDAEIILAHTLSRSRSWLHAHNDEELALRQREIAGARLDLRLDHVPIAYIIGHKEFYGRRFFVSPSTLIPRPESEQLIELLSEYLPSTQPLGIASAKQLVDIGTGTGCLGITAKLEHPELSVSLVDVSAQALVVAEKNAHQYNADVTLLQSDLLAQYPYTPDIVLANLPYVDPSWETPDDLAHEPALALFAHDHGLSIIARCFEDLSVRMRPGATAFFEADPRQWKSIETIAADNGFVVEATREFARQFTKK